MFHNTGGMEGVKLIKLKAASTYRMHPFEEDPDPSPHWAGLCRCAERLGSDHCPNGALSKAEAEGECKRPAVLSKGEFELTFA